MMRQTSMTWALGLWVTLTGWAGPLTDGWFGNGHYTHAALLGGWFWTLTGDELFLVYRDDGAGTFNDALPCAAVAASESSVAIELQTLEPTA